MDILDLEPGPFHSPKRPRFNLGQLDMLTAQDRAAARRHYRYMRAMAMLHAHYRGTDTTARHATERGYARQFVWDFYVELSWQLYIASK